MPGARHTGGVASRQVGTVTLPLAVAGHPALELCNTRAGWGEESPREYLTTYRDLVVWAREIGLVRPGHARQLVTAATADPTAADEALRRVLDFRGDLYAVLTGGTDEQGALDRVGAVVAAAAATARLSRSPGGGLALDRAPDGLDLPLHAVADTARRLVEDGLVEDMGRCPGTGCGWLFLRNGRPRRWCIMALCGNRAKARRHAQRRRQATRPAATG
jgi:predicted RNA-binding Zn ribbon-like protein